MIENLTFANPEYFWFLLIIVPIILFIYKFFNKTQAIINISSTSIFGKKSMFWIRFKYFLILLKIFAIIFLIIALSRPQTVDVSSQRIINKGIDIIMTIDISSSMLAQDLKPNRLNALKKVASSFIENRVNDRIGLVLYAGESYTKTPITSDKSIVKKSLSEIAYDGVIEDGTAIGMGLATSVNRLKESKAKSKVIILLTDGVNNSGFIDPKIASSNLKKILK